MMKKRGLLLVALSIVLGIGAAWFANNWVQMRSSEVAENANTIAVMTAAMNIPYGTKIDARHMESIQLPKEVVPSGIVMSLDDINGYVANADIAEGEMLMASRFAAHDMGSTLAALIGENMRAITVRVDDVVGVAGFLLPGNYVDVLATKVDRRKKSAKTDTVLKKIKVLAVDQQARANDSDPVVVRAVTLEMTSPQSETLAKSRAEGTIQLTLRNPNDEVLVAEKKKKRVYRPAPAKPTVTIIRGTQVAEKKTRG